MLRHIGSVLDCMFLGQATHPGSAQRQRSPTPCWLQPLCSLTEERWMFLSIHHDKWWFHFLTTITASVSIYANRSTHKLMLWTSMISWTLYSILYNTYHVYNYQSNIYAGDLLGWKLNHFTMCEIHWNSPVCRICALCICLLASRTRSKKRGRSSSGTALGRYPAKQCHSFFRSKRSWSKCKLK